MKRPTPYPALSLPDAVELAMQAYAARDKRTRLHRVNGTGPVPAFDTRTRSQERLAGRVPALNEPSRLMAALLMAGAVLTLIGILLLQLTGTILSWTLRR